jgi:23S rRNA pseudouridine1911/1915/1917 synthase
VPERYEFQIAARDFKKRLDEFLFAEFPHLSRLYLRELVRDEKCEVNGRWENRGYLLKTNDFVEIEIDRARQTSLQPEPIALEIVYEDDALLVVNKPSGMLAHPTVRVRTGTLLNALAHHLNEEVASRELRVASEELSAEDEELRVAGEELRVESEDTENNHQISALNSQLATPNSQLLPPFIRAGLIHRLDKDTSGLMVVAKTARAHRILCSHFQRKKVEKRYYALAAGAIEQDAGTIEAPVGRYAEERLWNIKADGKPAVSNFWVRRRFDGTTLVELEPVTGRTNQLRIHLAHVGHPIVGDVKYGGGEFSRLCLHAFRLCFYHPLDSRWLEFETELPPEFFPPED